MALNIESTSFSVAWESMTVDNLRVSNSGGASVASYSIDMSELVQLHLELIYCVSYFRASLNALMKLF